MPQEMYYIIVAIGVLVGAIWKIYSHLERKDTELRAQVDGHVVVRNSEIDKLRVMGESRYSDSMRKLAEVSERLMAEKLERTRELNAYVTRLEFDKRIDRFENTLETQDHKIDEILRHVSGLIPKKNGQ